jgi:hypothetical protein
MQRTDQGKLPSGTTDLGRLGTRDQPLQAD